MKVRAGSLRHLAATIYPYLSRRAMNVAKREADRQVAAAKSDGRLVKQPCVRCGRMKTVEAHHEDYARPLEVIWLCRFHHRLRHAELRDAAAGLLGRRTSFKFLVPLPPPEPVSARVLREHRSALRGTPSASTLVHSSTVLLADAMDAERVNESELARRARCSRQAINQQIACGVRNLSTLATLADVLGYDVHVRLVKRIDEAVA